MVEGRERRKDREIKKKKKDIFTSLALNYWGLKAVDQFLISALFLPGNLF